MESVTFKNRFQEKLSGTLLRPSAATGFGFVLGHCFTCSRHTRILIDLSNVLADLGFGVLRFDFSGNGQSEGRFEDSTYTKQAEEMIAAADFMKQSGAVHVLIGGHSMGAMVSLITAANQDDISGVIALAAGAAPLHPDRLLTDAQKKDLSDSGRVAFASRGRDLMLTREFFDDAAGYELPDIIRKIACPVLVVLAAEDTITASGPAKALFNGAPQHIDLLEVDGADHMFSSDTHRRIVTDHVTRWVQTHFLKGD